MNGGLNTAAIAMRPPPWVADGYDPVDMECKCYPRARPGGTIYVQRDGMVKVYNGGVISMGAQAINYVAPEWEEQPTPSSVQLRPFVVQSDGYLKLIGGRIGRIFTVTLEVTLENRIDYVSITLEIKQ